MNSKTFGTRTGQALCLAMCLMGAVMAQEARVYQINLLAQPKFFPERKPYSIGNITGEFTQKDISIYGIQLQYNLRDYIRIPQAGRYR